jgi:hypothetical protein
MIMLYRDGLDKCVKERDEKCENNKEKYWYLMMWN